MRVLITSKPGVVGLFSRPDPVISRPGQALVRVERVGLCGSDLDLFNGALGAVGKLYPRIQGHEVSGVVEQVAGPRDPRVALGQRVAVLPTFSCGRCYPCSTGAPNVCARLQVLGMHQSADLFPRPQDRTAAYRQPSEPGTLTGIPPRTRAGASQGA